MNFADFADFADPDTSQHQKVLDAKGMAGTFNTKIVAYDAGAAGWMRARVRAWPARAARWRERSDGDRRRRRWTVKRLKG